MYLMNFESLSKRCVWGLKNVPPTERRRSDRTSTRRFYDFQSWTRCSAISPFPFLEFPCTHIHDVSLACDISLRIELPFLIRKIFFFWNFLKFLRSKISRFCDDLLLILAIAKQAGYERYEHGAGTSPDDLSVILQKILKFSNIWKMAAYFMTSSLNLSLTFNLLKF